MPRMLVVVAHPDDETFGTGSVIASAAAAGAEVVVCCATRGEAGEDTSGTTNGPAELAEVRERELRAAARVLGAARVELLDFADSGFTGPMPDGSLSAVAIDRVVAPVRALIDELAPDVVVGMDPESVNDHRDHQRIGEATTIAFAQASPAGARLYQWTLCRSVIDRWQAELKVLGLLDAYVDMELGRADAEITTIIDTAHVADVRLAAIAEHRTQASPFTGISDDLARDIYGRDYLVRSFPVWEGGAVETTLFGSPSGA